MNKKFFPDNLKYLRTQRGLDQMDLAKLLNRKSSSTISEWEKGVYTPNVGTLSVISELFGVNLSDLMDKDLTGTKISIKPITNCQPIPLVGTIAAGTPILAEENITDYFNIDSSIDADFAVKVKGDSMIKANINSGDIVFIRKQPQVENKEIAAVLVDGEATLKRVLKIGEQITLLPENDEYNPILLDSNNDIIILGKMVANLKVYE